MSRRNVTDEIWAHYGLHSQRRRRIWSRSWTFNPTAIAAFILGIILVTRGQTLEGIAIMCLAAQFSFTLNTRP